MDNDEARDAIIEGEIVIIVFSNAIEQVPKASLAIDLLKIVKSVAGSEKIRARLEKL